MKNLKKLFALLLCLAMIFVMASCTKSEPAENKVKKDDDRLTAETLEGEWLALTDVNSISNLMGNGTFKDMVLADFTAAGMDFSNFKFNEKCEIELSLNFSGDKVTVSMDTPAYEEYVTAFFDEFTAYLSKPENVAAMKGLTLTEFEEELTAAGTTSTDYVNALVAVMGTKEDFVSSVMENYGSFDVSETCEYDIKGFTVIINKEEYDYRDDTLVYTPDGYDIKITYEKK